MAAGAQHPRDAYQSIAAAVSALGDNHSRFVPATLELPNGVEISIEDIISAQTPAEPLARRMGAHVRYISVPGFSGPGAAEFADRILDRVIEVDGPDVCGWIVDVRANTGGNMWPMLQGLSPILGEGTPGYFVAPDSSWTSWQIGTDISGDRRLARDPVAVAILHGGSTVSSGEAVVVAFRGRPASRTFGQPTGGLSTANRSIPLDDGAILVLTVSIFADRGRNLYGGTIEPDELIPAETSEEQTLSILEEWLLRQPACAQGELRAPERGGEPDSARRARHVTSSSAHLTDSPTHEVPS